MSTPPRPQHCPSPRELDDLELLTHRRAWRRTAAFNEPGSPDHPGPPARRGRGREGGRGGRAGRPRGAAARAGRRPGRRGRAADARPVRPVPAALPHPRRRPARVRRRAPSCRSPTPSPSSDLAAPARPPGPLRAARPGRRRHARPLPGRPGPGHPGRGRAPADAAVVAVPSPPTATRRPTTGSACRSWRNYATGDPVLAVTGEGEPTRPRSRRSSTPTSPAPDEQGLVVFFTGLSGSGKSTLARALHGP